MPRSRTRKVPSSASSSATRALKAIVPRPGLTGDYREVVALDAMSLQTTPSSPGFQVHGLCVLPRIVADALDIGHEQHRGRADAGHHLRVVPGA
jgi:hypothetical protein